MILLIVLALLGVLVYSQADVYSALYELIYLFYQLVRLPIDEINKRTKAWQYILVGCAVVGVLMMMIGILAPYKWDTNDAVYSDQVGRYYIIIGTGLLLIALYAAKVIVKLLLQYFATVLVNVPANAIDAITRGLNNIRIPFTSNPYAGYPGWFQLRIDTVALGVAVDSAFKPVLKTVCVIGALLFIAPNTHMLMWYLGLMLVLGFLADGFLKDYAKPVVGIFLLVMGVNALMYNSHLLRAWSPDRIDPVVSWFESKGDYGISWIIWDTGQTEIATNYYARVIATAPLYDAESDESNSKVQLRKTETVLSVGEVVLVSNPKKHSQQLGSEKYYQITRADSASEYTGAPAGWVSARKLLRVSVQSSATGVVDAQSSSSPGLDGGSGSMGDMFTLGNTAAVLFVLFVALIMLDNYGKVQFVVGIVFMILLVFAVCKFVFWGYTNEGRPQQVPQPIATPVAAPVRTSELLRPGVRTGLSVFKEVVIAGHVPFMMVHDLNKKEMVHISVNYLFFIL